ncbi:MAG: hypothetical protein A2Z16_01980 [Chloroflexi bacterium RBG_16_54_18]|nr:MAG: hypothetical protein A2Z16_01980 [Chloroflexi bacterium RBG_16_54_18]
MAAWEGISRLGLAEFAFRLGTHVLLVTSILVVAWGLRRFYSLAQVEPADRRSQALALSLPTPTYSFDSAQLPLFDPQKLENPGLSRQASLHTDLPSRPRFETIQYTTQEGDSLVTVAVKFGLQPETILWANQDLLNDHPHNFHAGLLLTILPVDGAYHRSSEGDNLEAIAKFYHADSETILSFPGNHLRPEEVGDLTNPVFVAGTWLIIPGGSRDFVTWKVPEIPRQDPAVAKILGAGTCETVGDGPIGSGNFIWPSDARYVNGYDFLPQANHFGIDIPGEGDLSAYAVDSGVVVYSGWNEWGFGNLVIINHGNDWQTLYANLGELYVVCGQTIWQGGVVGIMGEAANPSPTASASPYLHFEMMYKGSPVNPHDYLP